ncbi:MAG: hypothetical protein R3Y64_05170 [Peptostreptococcaceae bacterium]
MKNILQSDFDLINKKLYLDSPNLWIDFNDKISDNIFDELVMFIVVKYDFLSILEFVYENKLLDFFELSKNKDFKNIIDHLLSTANNNNSLKCLDLLNSIDKNLEYIASKNEDLKNQSNSQEIQSKKVIPVYLCDKCNLNIFECGYILTSNKTILFKDDSLKEIDDKTNDSVICVSCSNILNISPKKLDIISSINICEYCKNDLRSVGIQKNNNYTYNLKNNSFESDLDTFLCNECKNPISNEQINSLIL